MQHLCVGYCGWSLLLKRLNGHWALPYQKGAKTNPNRTRLKSDLYSKGKLFSTGYFNRENFCKCLFIKGGSPIAMKRKLSKNSNYSFASRPLAI